MKRNLLVVLRTCTIINAASGTDRYIKVSKHELVKHCISSLVNSINQSTHDIRLVVLDDHSSPEAVKDIQTIVGQCKFPTEFIPITDGTGNGWSMKKVYEQVEQKCTDLWYHIEDDYLHVPEAIQDMIDSVQKMLENVSDMLVKELPALSDSMTNEIGVNESQQFNQSAVEALTNLQQTLVQTRAVLQSALDGVTGQGGSPDAFAQGTEPDMGMPPEGEIPTDAGELPEPEAMPEPTEEPEAMPTPKVGREKR